jgi:hypothetical protein
MTETDRVRRYLMVADHALDEKQLAAKVQQLLAAGPCQCYLLVLATPAGTKDRIWWDVAVGGRRFGARPPNPGPAEELGWKRARQQLAHHVVRLRKLGIDADGETGEPHLLRAIYEVLAKRPADEIVLATSPHRLTRLLAMDLQHRVHRSFGLPVTVLGIARRERERERELSSALSKHARPVGRRRTRLEARVPGFYRREDGRRRRPPAGPALKW